MKNTRNQFSVEENGDDLIVIILLIGFLVVGICGLFSLNTFVENAHKQACLPYPTCPPLYKHEN